MNFYVDSGGTILAVDPQVVYQGSAMANTIRFIGAFPSDASVLVSYTLPNGVKTLGQLMTHNRELSGVISAKNGVTLNIWEQKIGVKYVSQADGTTKILPDYSILEQSGTIEVHFKITQVDDNGNPFTQTTAKSSFLCEAGSQIETRVEDPDEWGSLLEQVSVLATSLTEEMETATANMKNDLDNKAATLSTSLTNFLTERVDNIMDAMTENMENRIQNLEDGKLDKFGGEMTGELEIWDEDRVAKTALYGDSISIICETDNFDGTYDFHETSIEDDSIMRHSSVYEDGKQINTRKTYYFPEKSGTFALEEDVNEIKTQIGAANGIAPLDEGAKIPSAYLPSYVDDVVEFVKTVSGSDWLEDTLATAVGSLVFNNAAATNLEDGTSSVYYKKFLLNTDGTQEGLEIIEPEKGKIYSNTTSNLTYRWSGSGLVEISKSLALGETASTAYAGNKGKENAEAIARLKQAALGKTIVATFDITSASTTITFKNLTGRSSIDWGDGTVDSSLTHTYKKGKYTCIIYGVTSIGFGAFTNCRSLTSVKIGNGVTSIYSSAFYGCSSLTSVVIGDSVTSIGDYAFEGCSSLTSVTIGDSVTSIGDRAFSGCTSLASITFKNPTPITYDSTWFTGCDNLSKIYVPRDSLEAYKTAWTEVADKITAIAEMGDIENIETEMSNHVEKTGHTEQTVVGIIGINKQLSDIRYAVDDEGSTIAYRDSNGGLGVANIDYNSGNRAVNADSFPVLFNHYLLGQHNKMRLEQVDMNSDGDLAVSVNSFKVLFSQLWETYIKLGSPWEIKGVFEGTFNFSSGGVQRTGWFYLTTENNKIYGTKRRWVLDVTTETRETMSATAIKNGLIAMAYKWTNQFQISGVFNNYSDLHYIWYQAKYMEIAEYSWHWLPEVGETTDTNMLNGNGAVSATPAYIRTEDKTVSGDVLTQFWVHGVAAELDTYNDGSLTIDGMHMKVYLYD